MTSLEAFRNQMKSRFSFTLNLRTKNSQKFVKYLLILIYYNINTELYNEHKKYF